MKIQLIDNEYIRTNTGNIIKYYGKDKEFIKDHLSISDGKTIEFLGEIEIHSLDPIDIVKEKDKVNGVEVYSIGAFGLPFKIINLVNGTSLTSDKIETIETPQGCKVVVLKDIINDLFGINSIFNNVFDEFRDLNKLDSREYLYYSLMNKLREMIQLKNIIQNDPKEFPFKQERIKEWKDLVDKNMKDLQSIFDDILLYLKNVGYNIDGVNKNE